MTTYTLHKTQKSRGFTLIELLVVIGILAILLAITLIAINPARQFGQANDTKRRSDVTQILNAIGQYSATNTGQLPESIRDIDPSGTPVPLNKANFPALCAELVPNYLPALPVDPSLNNQKGIESTACPDTATPAWETGYTLHRSADNRITVAAPSAYDTAKPVAVTR